MAACKYNNEYSYSQTTFNYLYDHSESDLHLSFTYLRPQEICEDGDVEEDISCKKEEPTRVSWPRGLEQRNSSSGG